MTDKEKFLFQKKLAIASEVIQTAKSMNALAQSAFPKKRAFRKKDRRPLKRLQKKRAEAAFYFGPLFLRNRIAIIASQPFPKYPKGGMAVVGEAGPEYINDLPITSSIFPKRGI